MKEAYKLPILETKFTKVIINDSEYQTVEVVTIYYDNGTKEVKEIFESTLSLTFKL